MDQTAKTSQGGAAIVHNGAGAMTQDTFNQSIHAQEPTDPIDLVKAALVEFLGLALIVILGGLAIEGGSHGDAPPTKLDSAVTADSLSTPTRPFSIGYSADSFLTAYAPVGILYGVLIFVAGPLSGGHFNLLVTIGALATQIVHWKKGLANLGGQLFGSLFGILILRFLLVPQDTQLDKRYREAVDKKGGYEYINGSGYGVPRKFFDNNPKDIEILVPELFAAFILVTVFTYGVLTHQTYEKIGAYVGVTFVALQASYSILNTTPINPWRHLVPGVFAARRDGKWFAKGFWTYYVGGIIGGVAGAFAAKFLFVTPEQVAAFENARDGGVVQVAKGGNDPFN